MAKMNYAKPKMGNGGMGMKHRQPMMSANPYNVRMDAPTMPRPAKQRGTGTTRGYRLGRGM